MYDRYVFRGKFTMPFPLSCIHLLETDTFCMFYLKYCEICFAARTVSVQQTQNGNSFGGGTKKARATDIDQSEELPQNRSFHFTPGVFVLWNVNYCTTQLELKVHTQRTQCSKLIDFKLWPSYIIPQRVPVHPILNANCFI